MSDQTEKPDGALPKGYDANTQSTENTSSTETVRRKKINFKKLFSVTSTDQDQREKDLQEYESSYIARIEKRQGINQKNHPIHSLLILRKMRNLKKI